jgi:hypothetical protein
MTGKDRGEALVGGLQWVRSAFWEVAGTAEKGNVVADLRPAAEEPWYTNYASWSSSRLVVLNLKYMSKCSSNWSGQTISLSPFSLR